jgi:hypothetical protein
MAKFSLKINFPEKNITKTLQFEPSLHVCDALLVIREKFSDLNNVSDEDFGLYLNHEDPKRGVWLDPLQSLEYYLLRNGDSIEYKRKIRALRVKKLDGSIKTVLIDESQLVSKLIVLICSKIGITECDEYSLVREPADENHQFSSLTSNNSTQKRNEYENESDLKINHLKRKLKTDDHLDWVDHNKTLHEQGINENETLLFRRKFFFSDQNIDTRDPIQLNLLYVQTRDAIIGGTHPVTLAASCQFAGIQCQIQFGDYIEGKFKQEFLILKEFIPKEFLKSKEITRRIIIEHKKNLGINGLLSKAKYISLARSLYTYGVTFFVVKEKMKQKNRLVPRLLGISKDGIFRLNVKTKEIIKRHPITSVKRWTATENSLTLDFGDYSDSYYSVRTTESQKISQLIAGYIDIILKHKKPKDYLGFEDDRSDKMIELTIKQNQAKFNIVEIQRAIDKLETKTDEIENIQEFDSKKSRFTAKREIVLTQIDELISVIRKITTITTVRDEELDRSALESITHTVIADITSMSEEIKVIVDMIEDKEKGETIKYLTKKLLIIISELFIAIEPESKTSPKKLLNICSQVNKESEILLKTLKKEKDFEEKNLEIKPITPNDGPFIDKDGSMDVTDGLINFSKKRNETNIENSQKKKESSFVNFANFDESISIEDILDLNVKQKIDCIKKNEKNDLQDHIITLVKRLTETISQMILIIENESYSLMPFESTAENPINAIIMTTNVSIEYILMTRLIKTVNHLLSLAKKVAYFATKYKLNDFDQNFGKEMIGFSAAVSEFEHQIEITGTQKDNSSKKLQFINACQLFLSQTFGLVSVLENISQEFTDESYINQLTESKQLLIESQNSFGLIINKVKKVFSFLTNFDKTIELVKNLFQELEDFQKQNTIVYDFESIPCNSFEDCYSRMSFICNFVGSAVFELVTATTQNNYDFIVHSLRDNCNSLRNFTKSVINFTAVSINKEVKLQVIERAKNILENVILLIEELKMTLWETYDEVRHQRLTQITRDIVNSLNFCMNCTNDQKNVNKFSHRIIYKSELSIEFLKNCNFTFSKMNIELSTHEIKRNETTSHFMDSTQDRIHSQMSIIPSNPYETEVSFNIEVVNEVIEGLNEKLLIANSGQLKAESEESFDQKNDLMQISNKLIIDTKSLINSLTSNQKQIKIETQNIFTTIVSLSETVKLVASSLGSNNSDAQILLLNAVKDVVTSLGELIRATNMAIGKCANDSEIIFLKENMFSKVSTLIETNKMLKNPQEMGERSLITSIETIDRELIAFSSEGTHKFRSPQDIFRVVISVTLATDKALNACNSGNQFDAIVASDMGTKAISNLLIAIKDYKSESKELKQNLVELGKICALRFKDILQLLHQTIKQSSKRINVKHQMLILSRIIYTCVTEIVSSAKLIESLDFADFTVHYKVHDFKALDPKHCLTNQTLVIS